MKKPDNKRKRRRYRAPKIVTETLYERYGLACGKASPAVPFCLRSFKS